MEAAEPSAPAQSPSPAPEPVSAADHAVTSGNVSGFREARAAERAGKPLPTVDVASPPSGEEPPTQKPGEAPAERTLSKRQHAINDYERRIAEQAQRIHALETQLQTPPAAPRSPDTPTPQALAPVVDPTDPEPNHDDTTAYPEGQYDRKFIKDQARWDARQEVARLERDRHAQTARDAQAQSHRARETQFRARVADAAKADPAFLSSLSAEVRALTPSAIAQANGDELSALNALADEFLDSDHGPQLMGHFSQHPEDLQRFAALTPREFTRELARLEVALESATQRPAPKTLTDAPAPPTTLGRKTADPVDEIDRAVASGDMSAFKRARLRERAAAHR